MIAELNLLQIQDHGLNSTAAKNAIIANNQKFTLATFKNGLQEKLKPTIFAAQLKTLAEATNLASELEQSSSKQIMYYYGSTQRERGQQNQYSNNYVLSYGNSNRGRGNSRHGRYDRGNGYRGNNYRDNNCRGNIYRGKKKIVEMVTVEIIIGIIIIVEIIFVGIIIEVVIILTTEM